MKKFYTYSAVLAAAISLIGCGGGSDSSNNTPTNTTNTIKVINSSNFDYATVTVVADSGTVLYSGTTNCSAGKADCYVYASYAPTNESVNVLFKDAAGRLVRFSDIDTFLPEYTTLNPSSWEMGLYLTKQIVSKNQSSGDFDLLDTNLRLSTFFQNYESPDGKLDEYEELGEFYSKSLKELTALSEADFMNQFTLRLKSWEVASGAELPQANLASSSYLNRTYAWLKNSIFNEPYDLIPTAHAQTVASNCADGVSSFLDIASSLGELLPVVGDAVSGFAQIGANACSDDAAKWEKLFEQLRALQDSINSVGAGVTEVKTFLADSTLNKKSEEFLKIAGYGSFASTNNDNLRQIKSDYDGFLKKNGGYKDLVAYVDAKGSIAAAKSPEFEKLLNLPMKSASGVGILDKISNLVSNNIGTYVDAINLKCEKIAPSSTANFIHVRQQCNNILLSNMSNLVGVQAAVLPILTDVYKVLDKYDPTGTYGKPSYVNSYATATIDLKAQFKLLNQTLLKTYKSGVKSDPAGAGLFRVYYGINETLMKNMVARNCNWKTKDRAAYPAIAGWYAPNAKSDDNYIVTECTTGGQGEVDRPVKARYYYNNQGSVADVNNVSNVLGVLVAEAYTSKNGYYMYNNSNQSNTYVLKKEAANATLTPSDPNVTVTGGNGEYARWTQDTPIIRTAGRGANSAADGVWGESSIKGPFTFNWLAYTCNLGSPCKYNYNWLSFKDSAGFHYVIYYWAGGAWYGTNNPAGSATGMSCMTYDCSVSDSYTKVKFKDMSIGVDLR